MQSMSNLLIYARLLMEIWSPDKPRTKKGCYTSRSSNESGVGTARKASVPALESARIVYFEQGDTKVAPLR